MSGPNIPDYRAHKKKRLLRRVFSVKKMILLGIILTMLYCVTRPEYRGRIDLDTSRIETTAFPTSCEATLGEGSERVQVQLLSVAPRKERSGLVADLTIRICNPTEVEADVSDVSLRYVPGLPDRPGFRWNLQPKKIGSGFCDEFVVASPPLGELITFSANEGHIELRGLGTPVVVFQLPGCIHPTPVPTTPAPTATPAPTRTPTPEPTATATATPEPVCIDDPYDSPVSNNSQATALNITNGTYELRLCPNDEFKDLPYQDVDWFYFDFTQTFWQLTLRVLVSDSSRKYINRGQFMMDVYVEETDATGRRTLRLRDSSSTGLRANWSLRKRESHRYYLRVYIDNTVNCGANGIDYTVYLANAH